MLTHQYYANAIQNDYKRFKTCQGHFMPTNKKQSALSLPTMIVQSFTIQIDNITKNPPCYQHRGFIWISYILF